MGANLSIIKNNTTYTTKGGEDFFCDGVRITEIYVKKDGKETLVWQYDVTAPTITMQAPTSTDSNSPDITNSSTYTIKGVCEDTESGVKNVTVNGVDATLDNGTFTCAIGLLNKVATAINIAATDSAGNVATSTRYVMYIISGEKVSVSNYSGNTSNYASGSASSPYAGPRADAWASTSVSARYHIPRYASKVSYSISQTAGFSNNQPNSKPFESGMSSVNASVYTKDGTFLATVGTSSSGSADISKYLGQELDLYVSATAYAHSWVGSGYSCSVWVNFQGIYVTATF